MAAVSNIGIGSIKNSLFCSGDEKNEAAAQRKREEKAELDKLNEAYAKQMQRFAR